jgi:hypothetical protein
MGLGLAARFLLALGGLLIDLAPTLIGKVLISLGISAVTYTGFDTGLAFLKSIVTTNLGLLPAALISVLALLKVGTCVSMVTSAYLARFALDGLSATGSITKWLKR